MNRQHRCGLLSAAALLACLLCATARAADVPPVHVAPDTVPFGKHAALDISVGDIRDARVTLVPSGPYQYFHWPAIRGGSDMIAVDDRLFVAAGDAGLMALNRPAAGAGAEIMTLLPGIAGRMLRVHDDDAYVIDGHNELHVIDISGERPRVRGSYRSQEPVSDFSVSDGKAYLLSADKRLVVLDVQQAAGVREIGRYTLPHRANRILAARDLLYIAGADGLVVVAAREPQGMKPIGRYAMGAAATTLARHGEHVYLGSDRGLTVIDVSSPDTPRWTASHHRLGHITDIVIDGENALVRNRAGILTLVDIGIPGMPTIIAGYPLPEPVGSILLQNRLAIVSAATGITAIDFSPEPPALSNESLDIGEGVNYGGQRRAFVDDGLAYVADWFSGIHIYDVTDARRPRLLSSFPTPGSPKGIVVKNGIAYVADDDHGLQVIDVRDPRRPRHVANLPITGLAYTPKIVGDRLYLASHRGGFQIVDIANPERPRLISDTDTPGKAWSIDVQNDVAFVADDDNGLLFYDVGRAQQPVLVGSFNPGGRVEEVLVRGRYAYAAFFDDGLYVLDVGRPERPQPLAHIPTPGNARGLDMVGETLLIADWLAGVHLVDISNPARARVIGSYDTDGAAWGVSAVSDTIACVLDWWGGLVTLDISDRSRPILAARYNGRGQVRQLIARDGHLFAARDSGLQIFDIRNPLNPTWMTGVEFEAAALRLALSGDTAYVALQDGHIAVVDIRNPFAARFTGRFRTGAAVRKMQAAGPVLYVLGERSELAVFDITRRNHPQALARLPDSVSDFTVEADRLTATGTGNEILLYDVSRPSQPRLIQRVSVAEEAGGIAASDRLLTAVAPGTGVTVFAHTDAAVERVGFYNFGGSINDIAMTDELLLAGTGTHDLIAVDLSRPDQPVLQSVYTLLNPVDTFELHRGFVYFAGGEAVVALQLMPNLAVTRIGAGRYRLTVPGNLPLGTYDLLVTGADGFMERIRGAVRVAMPDFSKPAFTMEDLEKVLQRRGTRPR